MNAQKLPTLRAVYFGWQTGIGMKFIIIMNPKRWLALFRHRENLLLLMGKKINKNKKIFILEEATKCTFSVQMERKSVNPSS